MVYISDNSAPFPSSKTTLDKPGMRLPCIVRTPGRAHAGAVQEAMVTWADLPPIFPDVARIAAPTAACNARSFRAGLDGEKLTGRGEVFASHSFHEVTVDYPMRMVRTREFKLIHNLASGLPFPVANDLVYSPTWIRAKESGEGRFGRRPTDQFLRRSEFEL